MSNFKLADGLYLYPTPAGAYYCASSKEQDRSRQFLRTLFKQKETPILSVEQLKLLMEMDDDEKCLDLLYHCQKVGLIQGMDRQVEAPAGPLEKLLPAMLDKLSENGKVLLADNQGFYLSSQGFVHEVAEELSALSAEIANIHERRSGLLLNNLGLGSCAWSVVNAAGDSQVGFWPLFIGDTRFVVAIQGMPHFNQPEFVELVWALSIRYSANRK